MLLSEFEANKDRLAYYDMLLAMQNKYNYDKADRMQRDGEF
ncbi:hypothetical protein ACFLWK_01720 [Chloroflexota bacterium]